MNIASKLPIASDLCRNLSNIIHCEFHNSVFSNVGPARDDRITSGNETVNLIAVNLTPINDNSNRFIGIRQTAEAPI